MGFDFIKYSILCLSHGIQSEFKVNCCYWTKLFSDIISLLGRVVACISVCECWVGVLDIFYLLASAVVKLQNCLARKHLFIVCNTLR